MSPGQDANATSTSTPAPIPIPIPLPTPSTLTSQSITVLLGYYPYIAQRMYRGKLSMNKYGYKKVNEGMARDSFRFEGLVNEVAYRWDTDRNGGPIRDTVGLTKGELEELVVWKITHGHSRPFLPAMVRKNDSSAVGTQTAQAFSTLQNSQSQPPSQETILTALDQVCALKGVGPATGTLVLSVFEPTHVPFFQDEMFAWFFGPDHEKLKYSKPEYTRLLEAVTPVLQRIGCKAVELEKVAYVVGHVDLLFEEERQLLVKELGDIAEVKMEKDREGGTDEVVKKEPVEKKRAVGNKGKGRKRTVKDEDDGNGEDINQPPKRRSARNKG